MSKLKSGDIVEIEAGFTKNFYRGDRFEFITPKNNDFVIVRYEFTIHKNNLKKVEVNMKYTESNRYKLHQAIKATGFKISDLSLATRNVKTYFTGFTAESRFNSRGDITEERLNALLTTLAFAERELLGVGAKTVDDIIPKADEKGEVFTPDEKKALDHINHDCIEPVEEKTYFDNVSELVKTSRAADEYFSNSSNWKLEESDLNKEKSDSLKSVLIAFLVVVVLLALWFLLK